MKIIIINGSARKGNTLTAIKADLCLFLLDHLYLYEKSKALINRGMPVSVLKEDNIFERIISIKYDVPNNQLDKFEQYRKDIDAFYDKVLEKNG